MTTSNMSTASQSEKRRVVRFVVIYATLFLVLFGCVPYISAQQESYIPPSVAELDQFRQGLDQTLREVDQVGETYKQNKFLREALLGNPKTSAAPSMAMAQQQLQQMNYEELGLLHRALTIHFPQWRELPGMLGTITKKMRTSASTKSTGPTPNAVTLDSCSDAELAAPSFSDLAAAGGLEIAAAAAFEVVPEIANAPLVALWIPTAAAVLALETLNNIYDRCHGDADITEIKAKIDTVESRVSEVGNSIKENDNDNTGRIIRSFGDANTEIINNDNSNKAMILTSIASTRTDIVNNDNANTTTLNTNLTNAQNAIITNNNTNTTNIINSINSNAGALRDLLLRTQIEADLAEADNATYVGLYVTPTANGGYLDFVRFIVVDTIAKLAGSKTSQANGFLERSDEYRNAGNFKSAYQWLRKAYKTAVN